MELVLQIVSGQISGERARESERRKTFGRVGGRIGRAADCEWVLPSPYVSRYHATISHSGNTFYIESTGENGLALNDPTRMLPRFDRHALKDGDRVFIDEMEIVATLTGAAPGVESSTGIPELHANSGLQGRGGPLDAGADDLDPLKRLLGEGALADTAERSIPWNNSSSLADHFAPPRVEQPTPAGIPSSIAEDWEDEPVGEPPLPAPPVTSIPFQSITVTPPPVAPPPSDVLRSMLQGLIDERQSRAQLSAELRLRSLPLTSNPNPLHHAVNADDALRLLAAAPEAGRMTGAQAVTDALDEIRAHQLATGAAIRAAFQSMLSCFDPQALEARFDKRLKHAGVLPIGSKFRYWQLYVELFEELASGADSGFQKLFGEAFADAYETQLTALKGRARQPAHGT